jgi:hypothetical protein
MSQISFKIDHGRGLQEIVGGLALIFIMAQSIPAADVRSSDASVAKAKAASALTDHKTLRCSLQEGETTFIFPVPTASMLDGFKFVNENPAVRGELQIAFADSSLPANDPKWNAVSGKIAFANKRLFNLSMLGVNAKYVKLSFRVEKDSRIAAVGL